MDAAAGSRLSVVERHIDARHMPKVESKGNSRRSDPFQFSAVDRDVNIACQAGLPWVALRYLKVDGHTPDNPVRDPRIRQRGVQPFHSVE